MSIPPQGLLLSRGKTKTEQKRRPERREGSASMMLRLGTPILLFTLTLFLFLPHLTLLRLYPTLLLPLLTLLLLSLTLLLLLLLLLPLQTLLLLSLTRRGPLAIWCTRLAVRTSVLIEWGLSVSACQEGNRPAHMRNGLDVHVHAWYACELTVS